jgi:hypothetical protein
MRTHRQAIGIRDGIIESFETLIDYAEIIDGALYQSASMAGDFDLPTVKLAALFSCSHPVVSSRRLYRRLVRQLGKTAGRDPLEVLAADPVYMAVIDHEARQYGRKREAYGRVMRPSPRGAVGIFDFSRDPSAWQGLGRFVPYELAPEAQWAVHVAPPGPLGTCAITCGQNPWNKPSVSIRLGEFFAAFFAGGGHDHVAGGEIRQGDSASLERLIGLLDGQS